MEAHHEAWLSAHSERSREWLEERLRDGFDVHHLDGDHDNNGPLNLVLVEHLDHLRCLHSRSGNRLVRLPGKPKMTDDERRRALRQRAAEAAEPTKRHTARKRAARLQKLDRLVLL